MKDWNGIYIPLQGPHGVRPKAPAVGAWQSPGYTGLTQAEAAGAHGIDNDMWFGLRCDNLVVVDCDCREAAVRWANIDNQATLTWVRKTPRGYHFIYAARADIPGTPFAPATDVFGEGSHIDIRAGRTSQIVAYAPGYEDATYHPPRSFRPACLPANYSTKQVTHEDETWSEIPDGRGNNTMAAFAGAFRKQGMDLVTMVKCLSAINRITMTTAPMSPGEVIEIARSVGRYAPQPDIDIELDEDD